MNTNTEIFSQDTLQCTIWNEMAKNFDVKAYHSLPKPVLIAVSSCRVSIYNRKNFTIISIKKLFIQWQPLFFPFKKYQKLHIAQVICNLQLLQVPITISTQISQKWRRHSLSKFSYFQNLHVNVAIYLLS